MSGTFGGRESASLSRPLVASASPTMAPVSGSRSPEREASGAKRRSPSRSPKSYQIFPLPAVSPVSLALLFSVRRPEWPQSFAEWLQPKLPKPILPLPLSIALSRTALGTAERPVCFCILVRLLRRLLASLRGRQAMA